jgi:hypothetical protein
MSNRVCRAAAAAGDLAMLKYSIDWGCHDRGGMIGIYNNAIPRGHAHILRWLSRCEVSKFKWDNQKVLDRALRYYEGEVVDEKAAFFREVLDICELSYLTYEHLRLIVSLGPAHFDLLRENLVRVEGYPSVDHAGNDQVDTAVRRALVHGSLLAFDLLVAEGFPVDDNTVLSYCLESGDMGMLQTLLERGDGMAWSVDSSRRGFRVAARSGRLEDVRACMKQPGGSVIFGNGNGSDLCAWSASSGVYEMLAFALANTLKSSLGTPVCSGAVESGDLSIVKLAVRGGAPLSTRCTAAAIEGGHVEILEYLIFVGCPMADDPFRIACLHEQLPILRLLVSSNIVPVSYHLVETALVDSDEDTLPVIEWCLEVCDEFRDEAMFAAAERNLLEALKLFYAKVDEARWKWVFPAVLSRVSGLAARHWVEGTKTWV